MSNLVRKETVEQIETRIKELQSKNSIHFPKNYSPSNALNSAWLILQETADKNGKPALQVCTKESIANALFNMVVQGLSPAKKQVYFIVRGNKLCVDRSYHGTVAATKRLECVEDVFAQVVYKGDEFKYTIEHGTKKIVKHEQDIENIDNENIIGAYCTIIYNGGKEFTEIMNKKQIDIAWSKTRMKSNTVQKEFPEEMAKRTIINRTCKMFVNTSDDNDLIIEAFHDTSGADFSKENEVESTIKENANKEIIDIDSEEIIDVENTSDNESVEESEERKPGF